VYDVISPLFSNRCPTQFSIATATPSCEVHRGGKVTWENTGDDGYNAAREPF